MYQRRKELLEKIEEIRKRPLIAYITSIRPNMGAQMAGDAITSIIEQIETVPSDDKDVDFLIISNGGDPIAALRIITLLRERFKKVTVLIPYVAYSAATVLSLGADEIVKKGCDRTSVWYDKTNQLPLHSIGKVKNDYHFNSDFFIYRGRPFYWFCE